MLRKPINTNRPMRVPDLERDSWEDIGRIYTNYDDIWAPSVSTVLDVRPDPPGLARYKSRTSESERNWTKFYTRSRGTLVHYHCLNRFADEELWDEDEQESEDLLKGKIEDENGVSGGQDTWDRFQDELDWALNTWNLIRRIYGIEGNVIDVEAYIYNPDRIYAGQFDLLYQDQESNETVLADLKTGKAVYDSNLLQSVAYENAVEIPIDRLEIIRMCPDTREWEVSSSHDWMESRDDCWEEFCELREQFESERFEELKRRAKERAEAT